MNYKTILLIAVLLLTACTTDPTAESNDENQIIANISHKIVNTPKNADNKTLLVYFNEEVIGSVEQATVRSTATRSGITRLDYVLSEIEASSFKRLFPYGAKNEEETRAAGLHRWYVLHFPESVNLEQAAANLAAIAEINQVQFNTKIKKVDDLRLQPLNEEPNIVMQNISTSTTFNDPNLYRQWHYQNKGDAFIAQTARVGADINVIDAWKLASGDPSIIVAIVDEGVKYSHIDLSDNMWINTAEKNGSTGVDDDSNGYIDDIYGYNFADNTGNIQWNKPDDSGHGTHVAGTVAAVNNNNIGVCGVAGGTGKKDGVKLMSCQIFSGDSGGTLMQSAAAIKYAADNGASVLQCSWGYNGGTFKTDDAYTNYAGVVKQAIDYFIGKKNNSVIDGGIVIFAAGNERTPIAGYPGAYHNYIAVTSFAPDYLPAYYTNYDLGCNIAAPGGEYYISADQNRQNAMILSTIPSELPDANGSDYGYMQGTSMAAPHVSGVVALGLAYAKAKGKTFTVEQFNSMILTSVNDIDIYLASGTKATPYGTMNLGNYRKKMGTGSIDAYQLLMQIEGTTILKARVNTAQNLSLNKYFGNASANLTYTAVEISPSDMTKLGMTTAPSISYGKLSFHCTKPGVAKITIKAIAGGTNLGGGDSAGGKEISKEFAIVARVVQTTNGGWL